jgi:sirohydrochlorin ferrochelatase
LAIAQPRASEALERIGQAGWTRVIVAPHLLFAGQLILDLETSVERVAARFPRIEWIVADRLGPDAAVCAALCDRVAETAFGRAWGLRSGTGAGSDGDACAAMSLAADLASRGSSG